MGTSTTNMPSAAVRAEMRKRSRLRGDLQRYLSGHLVELFNSPGAKGKDYVLLLPSGGGNGALPEAYFFTDKLAMLASAKGRPAYAFGWRHSDSVIFML